MNSSPLYWFWQDSAAFRCIPAVLVGVAGVFVFFFPMPFATAWNAGIMINASIILLGGMCSGWAFSGWIGRGGILGLLAAFCAMWLCAFTCGFVFGTLAFPVLGGLAGGPMAVMILIQHTSAATWIIWFIVVQTIVLLTRRKSTCTRTIG